jgi:transcriptional regulator
MNHYAQYKTGDLTQIFAFIKQFPFAHICKNTEGAFPRIVHAPVIISAQENTLEFHIAKANPAFKDFANGGPVVAVFSGPNAHISPSMYKQRFAEQARSKTAPTWDYALAEIQGSIQAMDEQGSIDHLERLVGVFEASVPNGWSFQEIEPQTLKAWASQIQGFTFNITAAEATFKLSQEQSGADQKNIIADLRNRAHGHDLALAYLIETTLGPK